MESKKAGVQNALLSLLVEWTHLDDYIDPCNTQFLNLGEKEKELKLAEDSVAESSRILDEIRSNLEGRIEDVAAKEKEFKLFLENGDRELGFREKKLKDVELREEKIRVLFERFETEKGEFERVRELVFGELRVREEGFANHEREVELREMEVVRAERLNEDKRVEFESTMEELEWERKLVEERCKAVELKERWFRERVNGVELREMEMAREKEEIRDREEELESRERDWSEEWNEREEKLELENKLVEERRTVIELMEEEVQSREQVLESRERDWSVREEKLELEKKLVDERSKEFELKEDFKERVKVIDAKEKDVDDKVNDLRLKQSAYRVGCKGKWSDLIDILGEEKRKELEVREKLVVKLFKEYEMKEQYFKEWLKANELKEKEVDSLRNSFEERCSELECREKKLFTRLKEFDELKDKHFKELELREKEVHNKLKDTEAREKNVENNVKSRLKIEPSEDDPSHADIQFSINMDGKSLLLYLVEHGRDLDAMADEVAKALMLSKDPAKLVLDAIEGFYESSLKMGGEEFGGFVVKKSCILLLEHLRQISPKIQPHVKQAALKRAYEWKEKMTTGVECSLELTGWLQLLLCYGLDSDFEPEKLLRPFEVCGQKGQNPELCELLGYTDSVSGLVSDLVKAEKHVRAVRYVCAFGLDEKFQPASLLQDILKNDEDKSKTLGDNGYNPVTAKNEAIDKIVASLKSALGSMCSYHKLEPEFSPSRIELLSYLSNNLLCLKRAKML